VLSTWLNSEGVGSGNEVLGNRDLFGGGFDAVGCRPATASGETYGSAVDEQGAAIERRPCVFGAHALQ
jgi:hypothetical protein